jgi:trimeric autotransporter adhesin
MRKPSVLSSPARSKFLRTNNRGRASIQPWMSVAMGILLSLYCGCGIAAAQAITRAPAINTIAGNGTAGFSGDSGPATSAELHGPSGVAVDGGDNLYIADPGNNRIRKVAAGTGVITTIAGNGTAGYSGDNGPATGAELNLPDGVAIDSAGNLYIADAGNNVIRKVSASGTITTVAGNNAEGYSGDNGAATNATLYSPAGVAVDSAGNLYIADTNNNRIRKVDTSGTITTIAGNGTAGYTGDNGPATSATLNKPAAVVVASTGNLYIADTGNDVVRMIAAAGTISTIVGSGGAGYSGDGGPATSAKLNSPYGVNLDSAGDIYVADSMNNVVRMVNTAGIISTITGNDTNGYSGDGGAATSAALSNPQGVALDSQGNFYISDRNNNRVREVNTPTGGVLFPTTAVGSTSAAVTIPLVINTGGTTITGIGAPVSQGRKQEYAVTATGCDLNTALTVSTICTVSVTFSPGYSGQRPVPLQVVSSAGTFAFAMTGIGTAPQVALSPGIITTVPATSGDIAGAAGLISGGVTVDSAGNLYFAVNGGLDGNQVLELAPGASTPTFVFSFGNGSTDLGFGIAVDGAGNVYVVNPNFSNVVKVAPGSTTATDVAGLPFSDASFAGNNGYSGDNGPATSAELNFPSAIALDSAGNLYIADTNNNRIRKVAAVSGIITTIAGNGTGGYSGDNGPATSAELNSPQALALDVAGDLFIVDANNNRIRKVAAASGMITTVAGNGTAGYSGDNGPATSAEVSYPQGVAVDAAGDIYLADSGNSVVRMVNAAGIITTVAGNSTRGGSGDNGPATSAQMSNPVGVAIDSAGNLYIGDPSSPVVAVRQVNTSASALNFGNTSAGSTNTQTAAVMNIGNAPLAFALPATGQNPSVSSGFTLDSSSTCPQLSPGSPASTLSAGASCDLVIDFAPTAAGSSTGTATITDNNLNANTVQTVQLSGNAQTVATTTTINVATPNFGQTQVSVTVLATSGTAVPVGTVVFTVDGAVESAVTLNASAGAMLPSAVSNALAVGSHTIAAVYTSSSVEFGNSNATRIFSVGQAIPPTVTISPSTTSLTVAAGGSVTDTLTLASVGGYAGTLQFSCANLPQNATCSFQPSTVTLSAAGGPQTVVATIQTAGSTAGLRPASPPPAQNSPVLPAVVFWGSGLLTMALATKKRRRFLRNYHLPVLLALLAGSGSMIACGGGSSSPQSAASTNPPPTAPSAPATPAGTSTVQISASNSGNKVQSFTVTLTVQ